MSAAGLVAPATAGAATQISYPSFSDVSALQLNGNAYQNGTTVQLTDAASNEAGSVYTSSPVDVSGSWSVAYHMQFTAPGDADGAAFVIQPVSSTALAPSTGSYGGSGHGYQATSPYLALDIDEYHGSAGIVVGPEAPYNGVRASLPAHSQTPDWYVWADYDATAQTLSMYLSTSSAKPAAPLVTRTGIDLASILGTTQAYAGFAGATGGFTMGIDVVSWFFGPSPQPPVAEAPISVTAAPVAATEGAQFSGTVATVTGDSDSPPSDYTAQIDWGDGTTSQGTVDASGNVSGSHTYSDEGSYTVTTTVTDADDTSNTGSATSAATVADAPLTAGQLTVSGGTENGQAASLSFAFSDASTAAPVSDFSATINWGDGSITTGATVSGGAGAYSVTGSHTYA
ncbi:MAG TPA: PKD domain-containing protein, partial [Solirubrobacteraceae bacterium]